MPQVERGCDVSAAHEDGRTALHLAAARPDLRPIVDLLLDAGAANSAAADGHTAADAALANGARAAPAQPAKPHTPGVW